MHEKESLTVKSKAILVLGLLVFALGIYLVGGNVERSDVGPRLAEQQRAIEEKDEKIQNLESQLAELRRDNQGTSQKIDQLKAKLVEAQKDLAAMENRLANANREITRLSSSSRTAAISRTATSTIDTQPSPKIAARVNRAAVPRLYETVRSTPVYEEPANSSRVIAQIGSGTQITVVGSAAGWLEVRSKHGKPPGFIRADDAMFLSRAN